MNKKRSIDRQIAELLGYKVECSKSLNLCVLIDHTGNDVGAHSIEEFAWEHECPQFSSDWNAMRLLVEWLQERGGVEIGYYGARNGDKWCTATILTNDGKKYEVTESTAPLALCQAVLSLPKEALE